MKHFYLMLFCIITVSVKAQYISDSISWALGSNDSVSSSTYNLRGKKENLANNIYPAIYRNGYQKITKPDAGWPSVADSSNSFIEFPFGTQSDVCYDTTGGNHYCIGYNYFSAEVMKLTGYVYQVADSVIMEVYFYDTSCYAAYYGFNYKYIGNIAITSDNDIQPTTINFRTVQENDNMPIHACGAGGKYSAIRLYPITGGDVFIKNMTIAGSAAVLLPINFKYLKGAVKNETIKLTWGIDNVQDLQRFVIEKSIDGIIFNETAIINSTGIAVKIYSWIDNFPFEANNFYRVKAVEKTGKTIFSEIIKVTNPLMPGLVAINPNPVTDKRLQFILKNVPFGKYFLTVSNQTGQNIFSVSISHAGANQKTIALPKKIVSGVYYIRIENAEYTCVKKVIIL